jgi:hypothetical protein
MSTVTSVFLHLIKSLIRNWLGLLLAVVIGWVAYIVTEWFTPSVQTALIVSIAVGYTILLISIFLSLARRLKLLSKEIRLVLIAMIGPPISGKTVYIASFFDRLDDCDENSIAILPYSADTVVQKDKIMEYLRGNKWPPATSPNTLDWYNARVTFGRTDGIRLNYKMQVADFAGEYTHYIMVKPSSMLHNSTWYRVTIDTDALLVVIDGEVLFRGDSKQLEQYSNDMRSTLQILLASKGVDPSEKLRAPVAFVITKSDILRKMLSRGERPKWDQVEEEAINRLETKMPELSKFAKRYLKYYKIFAVSATGDVDNSGSPPDKIVPENLCKPIIWVMRSIEQNVFKGSGMLAESRE